jgi:hypothetical protein
MKMLITKSAHHVWALEEEHERARYYMADLFLYDGNDPRVILTIDWEGELDSEILGKLYTACRYLEQHGELPEGEWTDMPPKQLPKGF